MNLINLATHFNSATVMPNSNVPLQIQTVSHNVLKSADCLQKASLKSDFQCRPEWTASGWYSLQVPLCLRWVSYFHGEWHLDVNCIVLYTVSRLRPPLTAGKSPSLSAWCVVSWSRKSPENCKFGGADWSIKTQNHQDHRVWGLKKKSKLFSRRQTEGGNYKKKIQLKRSEC